MVSSALKLIGLDVQRQWLRFKAEAESFKLRATGEFRRTALNAGLAAGFALAGIFFAVLTVVTGLIALYRWVAIEHGQFAGLGAVAALTAVMALVLLLVAVSRAKAARPAMPPMPDIKSAVIPSALSSASFKDAVTHDLGGRAADMASDAVRSASDAVRTGSRETLLFTLAAAVIAGVVIGRRSGANR